MDELGLTPAERQAFETAMTHPYECTCEDCIWFKKQLPDEDDE